MFDRFLKTSLSLIFASTCAQKLANNFTGMEEGLFYVLGGFSLSEKKEN